MRTPEYSHPTFRHFLQFHIGPFVLDNETREDHTVINIVKLMKRREFPFSNTCLGADVHLLNKNGHALAEGLTFMCTQGESSLHAVEFLSSKVLADFDNKHEYNYGPIIITSKHKPSELTKYYTGIVKDIFHGSIRKSIIADHVNIKTNWYGRVNAHEQKKYLDAIIAQLMSLDGVGSVLTPHLNTLRGEQILTDSARAASLAISLVILINPKASDRLIYTIGFACFVQHFGVLVNPDAEYYPGLIYDSTKVPSEIILAELGVTVSPRHKDSLSRLNIEPKDVLEIVHYTNQLPEDTDLFNIACIHCASIANQIVETYFTENTRIVEHGYSAIGTNPSFGSYKKLMARLDHKYNDTPFYRYHRDKISRFIKNADHYYKHHILSVTKIGGYVSEAEKKALESDMP